MMSSSSSINIKAICAALPEADLVAAMRAAGLGELVRYATAARSALCGDAAAASALDHAAKAHGCACKGSATAALAKAVSSVPLLAAARGVVGSGIVASSDVAVGAPTLDWNCRATNGDLAACDLERMARQGYVVKRTQLYRIDTLEAEGVQVTAKSLGLPEAIAGAQWFLAAFTGNELETTLAGQELCLEFFSVARAASEDGPVAQFLTPSAFAVAPERLADNGAEGVAHVFDYPAFLPRNGYLVNEDRCRCTKRICLCVPANGRLLVAAQLPPLPPLFNYYVETEWERTAVAVGCPPCELKPRCDRLIIQRDPYLPALSLRPETEPEPEPEPEPPAGG